MVRLSQDKTNKKVDVFVRTLSENSCNFVSTNIPASNVEITSDMIIIKESDNSINYIPLCNVLCVRIKENEGDTE